MGALVPYTGMKMAVKGETFALARRISQTELQFERVQDGFRITVTDQGLVDGISAGDYEVLEVADRPRNPRIVEKLKTDLAAYEPEDRKEAIRKFTYVHALRAAGVSIFTKQTMDPLIEKVANELSETKRPSWITVWRWRRDLLNADGDLRALLPDVVKRKSRNPSVYEMFRRLLRERFLARERPTITSIHTALVTRLDEHNRFLEPSDRLLIPSLSTVCRWVKKIEKESREEFIIGRRGQRQVDVDGRTTVQGPQATRPLERVLIDHTLLDLFCVDSEHGLPIGRPWLTVAIDTYSRMIVGFYISFEPPNYVSVSQCLKNVILSKAEILKRYPGIKNGWDCFGVPEFLVVDNGPEFHSDAFTEACLQLGIEIVYSPVRVPWYKAHVERFFGTMNKQLLHGRPGTTFSNIFDKKDYDPKKNAVVTFDDLVEAVVTYLVDVYAPDMHGEQFVIPALRWQEGVAVHPLGIPRNRHDLDIVLGHVDRRTLSHTGIEFMHLHYNSEDLGKLRRAIGDVEVMFRYDYWDISRIHVTDPRTKTTFDVPAINQTYTAGLTRWQHQVIVRFARKTAEGKVNKIALAHAKERVIQIVTRGWRSAKRPNAKYMARWLGIHSDAPTALARRHVEGSVASSPDVDGNPPPPVLVTESSRDNDPEETTAAEPIQVVLKPRKRARKVDDLKLKENSDEWTVTY